MPGHFNDEGFGPESSSTGTSDGVDGGGADTGDHDGDEQYGSDTGGSSSRSKVSPENSPGHPANAPTGSTRSTGPGAGGPSVGGGGGGVDTGDHDGDEKYGSDSGGSSSRGKVSPENSPGHPANAPTDSTDSGSTGAGTADNSDDIGRNRLAERVAEALNSQGMTHTEENNVAVSRGSNGYVVVRTLGGGGSVLYRADGSMVRGNDRDLMIGFNDLQEVGVPMISTVTPANAGDAWASHKSIVDEALASLQQGGTPVELSAAAARVERIAADWRGSGVTGEDGALMADQLEALAKTLSGAADGRKYRRTEAGTVTQANSDVAWAAHQPVITQSLAILNEGGTPAELAAAAAEVARIAAAWRGSGVTAEDGGLMADHLDGLAQSLSDRAGTTQARYGQQAAFEELQADLLVVAEGRAGLPGLLAKWEADPRSAGLMLQERGEQLWGEEVGEYEGPRTELSAVEWLRQAVAEDSARRAAYQDTPEYNRMLLEQEVGGFDPALGMTAVGLDEMAAAQARHDYQAWLPEAQRNWPTEDEVTRGQLGRTEGFMGSVAMDLPSLVATSELTAADMERLRSEAAGELPGDFATWEAHQQEIIRQLDNMESYGGNYSPWLDADGNQVATEAEATYRIEGTGPQARIVGLRTSNDANNDELSLLAETALTGLMATYYGDDAPAIQQRSEDIAGMLRYGPHHAKHPSELLGQSDQNQMAAAMVERNLKGRLIDQFGTIEMPEYNVEVTGPVPTAPGGASPQLEGTRTTVQPMGVQSEWIAWDEQGNPVLKDGGEDHLIPLSTDRRRIQGLNPDNTCDLETGPESPDLEVELRQ